MQIRASQCDHALSSTIHSRVKTSRTDFCCVLRSLGPETKAFLLESQMMSNTGVLQLGQKSLLQLGCGRSSQQDVCDTKRVDVCDTIFRLQLSKSLFWRRAVLDISEIRLELGRLDPAGL